jgi:bifunctional non-homologous end joining protein LigD
VRLKEYKAKRNFSKTAEPSGGKPLPKAVKGASRFIIQKHDASRLHYDFRLEMDGVLKSWAVPKGLPWKQGEKHLAVEVEDHPVDYAVFEGVIPQGQYGGGTVMLWDRGKYYVYGEEPLKALRDGRLHLVLDGEKAKGEWALIRLRGDQAKNQWLIIKAGSSAKPISKKLDDASAKSGRTMKQIASERDAEWRSNRIGDARDPFKARIKSIVRQARRLPKSKSGNRSGRPTNPRSTSSSRDNSAPDMDDLVSGLPNAKPHFIEPMKPRLLETPPTAGDWLYELKFDGIRAIAVKNGGKVNLFSRNENELRSRFPEIAEAVKALPLQECVIDGEIVALDEKGRSSFQLLQAHEMEGRKAPICFYVFDLPQLEGKSLIKLPLLQRKEVLAKICGDVGDPIRFSGEIGSDASRLLAEVRRRDLEGIVGKQRNSVYEPGRRSGAWIKLKCVNEQEFVIGGYTPPAGSRKHFGAILVGYYEAKKKERDNRLFFAGKVGSGFTGKTLSILHKKFQKEEREHCPFADLPAKLATGRVRPTGGQGGQWVQGITPSMMRRMHWVNPVFVAQIKFAEWTRDGKLRQPVFLGLREDKDPRGVTRE